MNMAAAAPTKPRAPMSHTVFKFFFASHMYGRLRARGPPHAPASCGRVEVHVVPVRVPVSGISAPRLTCTWLDSRAGCCVRSPPCLSCPDRDSPATAIVDLQVVRVPLRGRRQPRARDPPALRVSPPSRPRTPPRVCRCALDSKGAPALPPEVSPPLQVLLPKPWVPPFARNLLDFYVAQTQDHLMLTRCFLRRRCNCCMDARAVCA